MTTPNDPYNSANQRPFDDEEILDPIAENSENPVPQSAPEADVQAPEAGIETDDAPDFGNLPAAAETPAADPAQANAEKPWWESAEYDNEPRYSATGFESEQPASAPQASEPHVTPAEANSNPNPTLAGYFAGQEAVTEDPAATPSMPGAPVAPVAPESEASPQRTSVMDIPQEEKPTFATASPDWGTEPAQIIEIPDEPRGRGWLHVGSFFLTLILIPVAWYLLSDAGARLFLVENSPWETKAFSFLPLLELVGGLVVVAILWLTARATSLGAQFWGGLLTLAGVLALVMPGYAQQIIHIVDEQIGDYNAFTGNVIHHINLDLGTGRIAIAGFMLLMTGIAAHSARRRGQAEAEARTQREFLLKEKSNSANN